MKVSFIEKINKDARHIVCLVNEPSMVDVLVDDTMLAAVVKASYKEHGKAHGHLCWPSGNNASENIEIAVISVKKEFDLLHCREIGARLFKCLKSSSGAKRVEVVSALNCSKNTEQDMIVHIACGMLLASYNFDKYCTKKQDSDNQCCAEEVCFVTEQAKLLEKDFIHYSCMTSGIFLTRDLVSEPANNLPPATYLARIKDELEPLGVRVSALDKAEMSKLGMGALLGVAQGSKNDPFTVIMQWNGADDGEYPVALVGKGVTFDSGGLSLKPAKSMEDMKTDMAGSAVVVGALKTLAMRKTKMNIVGIVGLVENMPSGSAQRPGDVVKSLSGQTIEVLNTDAEGRLVLADVLWYAADRFKPAVMIDLATLTGAAVVALGNGCAALMSNDDQLAQQIELASQRTGETVWRLPLLDEYDKHIDSTIADVRNTSTTSGAGTITAAKFLQRFVKEGVKWAHLDIAAVAWQTSPVKGTTPKGASGFGVELLMNFLYKNYDI